MPTRWDAETDAAALISNAKFNAHPENAVGLMTMAGKQQEIINKAEEHKYFLFIDKQKKTLNIHI